MSIRYARTGDLSQIRALWDLSFPEEPEFNQWFFKEYYKLENTLIYSLNEIVCSMLQIFPYHLRIGSTSYPVHYIFGVCTHPQYRNQGFMEQLLNYTCHKGKNRGDYASILIPQNNGLFKLYEKYGYVPAFYINRFELTCKGATSQTTIKVANEKDIKQVSSLYEHGTSLFKGFIVRDNSYWLQQMNMFNELGDKVYFLQSDEQCLAYGFATVVDGKLVFQEAIGQDEDSLFTLVEHVAQIKKYNKVTVFTPNNVKGTTKRLGCIKFLQGRVPKKFYGYMNLMFN